MKVKEAKSVVQSKFTWRLLKSEESSFAHLSRFNASLTLFGKVEERECWPNPPRERERSKLRLLDGGASLGCIIHLAPSLNFAFVFTLPLILFSHFAPFPHVLVSHSFDIYFHCFTFTALDFSLYPLPYLLNKHMPYSH